MTKKLTFDDLETIELALMTLRYEYNKNLFWSFVWITDYLNKNEEEFRLEINSTDDLISYTEKVLKKVKNLKNEICGL